MGTEGTYDSRREQGGQGAGDASARRLDDPYGNDSGETRVPRPTPPPSPLPPAPLDASAAVFDVRHWLRAHRADAEPGLWRYEYRPKAVGDTEEVPIRALVMGALISAACGIFAWTLWRSDYTVVHRLPLKLVTPSGWWRGVPGQSAWTATAVYNSLFAALLIYFCGRLGNWPALYRRLVMGRPQPARAIAAALTGLLVVWIVVGTKLLPFHLAVSGILSAFEPESDEGEAVKVLIGAALLWPFARTGGWLDFFRKTGPLASSSSPEALPGASEPEAVPAVSEAVPDRALLLRALKSLVSALLLWSLWRNGYLDSGLALLKLFTPDEWWYPGISGGPRTYGGLRALYVYEAILFGLLAYACGRFGNFPELFRRHVAQRGQPFLALAAAAAAGLTLLFVWKLMLPVANPVFALVGAAAGGEIFQSRTVVNVVNGLIAALVLWPFARLGRWRELIAARSRGGSPPPTDTAAPDTAVSAEEWPDLRAAGWADAADTLTAELRTGRMNDVDVARLHHAWKLAAQRPDRLAPLAEAVLRDGGAAALHPSGRRDLPLRTARHDVLTGQVRIGRCADDPHNPYVRRGTGLALEPALLGTSLLAVGPPGAGKSDRLIRPVVEALALRALAGQAAVLAVGGAGAPLGPDDAFDVVVRVGHPGSAHDIDLYGGTIDSDEAAAVLAEGLVGDIGSLDSRRAATVLAQLLGPYRAAHGHFPSVPALRELLDGAPDALTALRAALEAGGHQAMLRELDARARQAGGPGDPAPVLADRVALLDRPAFAGFFATGPDARPFELRALGQYPLRVRVDLPERGHAEASRLLTRLLLAQFTAITAARTDTTLFACLVLDDATHALTAETVRGIRRLRSVNAGAVLALRTVDDVPEALHTPLLGAVGCTVAFSGITTWDGKRFAEAWGKEWVETREVAQHTVFADQPFTRALHALRKLVTGKAVTTDAVTVRQVEKERWSASELAYAVPAGHAVVRVATVHGEHAPPLLVHLDG